MSVLLNSFILSSGAAPGDTGVGDADGSGAASGAGAATKAAAGSAGGVGVGAAVGRSTAAAAGSAGGSGGASAPGDAGTGSDGSSAGSGAASGVGGAIASATGTAAGSGGAAAASPPAGHRYWRLYITDTDGGDGYTEIAEIEMAESILGQNVCAGGTPIASSYFGGNTPSKAFDGSYTVQPGWIGSSASFPQWIGYDFGAGNEKNIQSIGITGPNSGYTGRAPKTFNVEWSDDGSSWTLAWSVSSSTGWSTNEFRRFDDPGASTPSYSGSPWGSHSYWRIHCAQPDGGTLSSGEIEFRATPGGSDQANGGSATASSEFGGGYEASKAFDNNASTLWSAASGDDERWIRYAFDSAVSVGQIAISARNDNPTGASSPSIFAVQFADSTSGPWTTAWFVNGSTGWGIGETRTFTDPAYV